MPNNSHTQLYPAQKQAFDSLTAGLQLGSILRLSGGVGRGKTTILQAHDD
jgi:tRNA A37 threonylcarbamoyladenosine biosynthesis protein TsaE